MDVPAFFSWLLVVEGAVSAWRKEMTGDVQPLSGDASLLWHGDCEGTRHNSGALNRDILVAR
jgi:hypothetical protein